MPTSAAWTVAWKVLRLFLMFAGLWLGIDYARILVLHKKMPPGIVPLPLVGNTHLLPSTKPWLYFEKLSKSLKSPVITFWIGRNPTIWINTAQSAHELLEAKAHIYKSRPRMRVFAELSGMNQSPDPHAVDPGNNLLTMFYGKRFRELRRLTYAGVGKEKCMKYRGFQNDESRLMALDLLRTPGDYVAHIERYATSVVSIIAFGLRVERADDPLITRVLAKMRVSGEMNVPGRSFPMLLETFPMLSHLPASLFPWIFRGAAGRRKGQEFFYSLAEDAASSQHREPSYSKMLLEVAPRFDLSRDEVASLVGNLFGAGSETTSSTLITFILACCNFPESLPKAWEELDRVVGDHRSPTWDDQKSLVYVNAFVKEVFRWRSVAVMGGQPHAPVEDDRWHGYHIPKSAWVQGNIWAIHHNDQDFPNPHRFEPERFLEGNTHKKPFPNKQGHMSFGWGRRVCSGQTLAEQGVFNSVTRLTSVQL